QYIAKLGERMDMAYAPQIPVDQLIDETQGDLMLLQETRATGEPVKVLDAVKDSINRLDVRFNSDGEIVGTPTGFEAIDKLLLGLRPGNLIIVAGRPSMGKTSFAMNIVENAVLRYGKTAAVFEMEMTREELADRSICSIGRIPF